ncbi:DNA translocase FtsK [Pseudoprimorskyibacter insulae]|uniref:DNA translocase FtsK n=1 Tax=Pseudoprimorskyibacter insulae TaxID=1695997 RepID=A0A2R8AVH7_9RHOB|nr:DNA translocase FtsK [Pseudoprimorskyibacter insulae]SPF79879.1 DNA translocase FtsK [Pseudoprimorskyibacter insulae]
MAYQARGRDPLFDSNMQAAIEKRGKELLGLGLIALGLMVSAMIYSYSPEDPSWLSSTDAPVQNWMGHLGASIAAPLFMIVGMGSWGLAVILLAWGLRFTLHRGDERAAGSLVFAPIWIALAAIYGAGLPVPGGWPHSFGLGGLFGDMMMGSLINLSPFSPETSLNLISLVLGFVIVGFGAFILGFTRSELTLIARFLVVGVIMVYATFMALLGRGASGAVHAAQAMQSRQAERRDAARRQAEETAAFEAEMMGQVPAAPARSQPLVQRAAQPEYETDLAFADPAPEPDMPEAAPKGGFLARMPKLVKRAPQAQPLPEPELYSPQPLAPVAEAPADDRIRAKIADAVKSRVRTAPMVNVPAPAVKSAAAPMYVEEPHPAHSVRSEPPLRAPSAQPMVAAPAVAAPSTLPPVPEMAAAPAVTNFTHVDDDDFGQIDEYARADDDDQMDDSVIAFDDDEDDDYDDYDYAAPAARIAVEPAKPKKVVQTPVRKPTQLSRRAQAEAQPQLRFEEPASEYDLPPLALLMDPAQIERHHLSEEALEENARMLEAVLDDYGVKGEIVSVRPGPVVTMYELEPAPGLKASRVIGLADDIARSMSALSARVSTVPGRSVIGIELPNANREMVALREILGARDYGDGKHKLPLALGKDIGGEAVIANLAKMPHLLIAGTTGSGKSVAINTMILSLLYKLTPDDCRLIMIDPKMLELSVYDGIPHLLSPVVTDPKKAVVALKWVVAEMEERYRKMSKMGVRNIDGYNSRVEDALGRGEMFSRTVQTGFDEETGDPIFETEEFEPKKMPYIVVIVDEMADLMMVAGKEIEACIQRLAQMARASGIHLIMATQRPSVDVITGTIKANFPTRISFQVTSKIDSRTILGEMGAEQLLGMGDMLYMAGGAKITRCHGPFVSDEEVEEIVNHLKAFGPPEYVGGVVDGPDEEKEASIDAVLGLGGNTDGEDALYDQAVAIVLKDRKCSTSYIQRKLAIGYNKAARLVEQMEDQGVVSAANHVGKREILVPEQ